MKRARMDPPDSLEMLLDTMCNTFGGIILIALLIALFARDSQSPTAPSSSHRESSEMFRERIEQAEADLARAVALEQELEARVTTPAQADLLQLLEQRDQVRSAADSLVSDLRAASSPASRRRNARPNGGSDRDPGVTKRPGRGLAHRA
jgi:hypothetical protein